MNRENRELLKNLNKKYAGVILQKGVMQFKPGKKEIDITYADITKIDVVHEDYTKDDYAVIVYFRSRMIKDERKEAKELFRLYTSYIHASNKSNEKLKMILEKVDEVIHRMLISTTVEAEFCETHHAFEDFNDYDENFIPAVETQWCSATCVMQKEIARKIFEVAKEESFYQLQRLAAEASKWNLGGLENEFE